MITGGSRGFGRGAVEALAAQGMSVLALARNPASLALLKDEVKGAIETVAADVTSAEVAVEIIQRERPHLLLLNAGAPAPIQDFRFQSWETFSVNWDIDVKGAFTWAREALLAPLEKDSRIIIVSSMAATTTAPAIAGYAAAKLALVRLAKGLAIEAGPMGIHVHYLLPALTTETDMGSSAIKIFARRSGLSEEAVFAEISGGPPLTPSTFGNAILRILTRPDYANIQGFKISGQGLIPIEENEAILTG